MLSILMRMLLFLLLVVLLRRILRRVLLGANRPSPRPRQPEARQEHGKPADGLGKYEGLTEQGIDDADFEEIP